MPAVHTAVVTGGFLLLCLVTRARAEAGAPSRVPRPEIISQNGSVIIVVSREDDFMVTSRNEDGSLDMGNMISFRAMQESLMKLGARMDSAETRLDHAEESISALDTNMTERVASDASTASQIDGVKRRLDNQEQSSQRIDSRLTGAQRNITLAQEALANAASFQTKAASTFSDIWRNFTSTSSVVSALSIANAQQDDDLTALTGRIAKVETGLQTVNGRATALDQKINAQTASLSGSINAVSTSLTSYKSDVSKSYMRRTRMRFGAEGTANRIYFDDASGKRWYLNVNPNSQSLQKNGKVAYQYVRSSSTSYPTYYFDMSVSVVDFQDGCHSLLSSFLSRR